MQESTMVAPTAERETPYAVEMRNICKAWPGVVANDHVNLTVRRGQIHALVGENGAGKSTLMNILYGLIHPDSGEILINGQQVHISGPRDAIHLKIGMVHQHFMLIPPLTVAENIVLGHEPGSVASTYEAKKARATILALSKQYGLPIDPDIRIEKLSVGLQQRVEILKILYRAADILIMDEPTGVLTPQETFELFGVLRGLVQQGKTIIFITHKLREVLTGMRKITGGKMTLTQFKGEQPAGVEDITTMNAREERRAGLAHIPEDRRGSGLVLTDSIEDNLILGRQRWPQFSWAGLILLLRNIAAWAKKLIAEFDVRTPSAAVPARALSGGNQQKLIIAREFSANPTALIAAQPTRGVDIGAIEFIHRRIIEQRDAGKAVLLVSAELDEIRSLSDRIAVMYEGRIVDIVSPEATEEQLGILMTGGHL